MAEHPFYVGTSGWAYDDWSGVFYPAGLKASERLSYYVGQFNSLEINVTFYRTPSQAMIDAWNRRLPEDFQLIVKGPRAITHLARLRDCRQSLDLFWQRAEQLRTLRIVLWQLPPSLRLDGKLLDDFLAGLPREVRHAVEFRHASWWTDEAYEVLARHQAALVAVSHPSLPEAIVPTADFLYLRFHGLGKQLYRYDYSAEELSAWASRAKPCLSDRALYALFNNGYEGKAVRNARMLRDQLRR